MIYIFIPNVPAEPIGGVQTLFDYAERLNELAGLTIATIVCPARYVRNILPRSYAMVPVLYTKPTIEKKDILIFSEVLLSTIDQYPTANKKYIAVLNYGYFEVFARKSARIIADVTGFITNSKYTAKQLTHSYPHQATTHIPHVIESRFKSTIAFPKRQPNSILIMNRKNTRHIPKILSFLESVPHTVTIVNNVSSEQLISLYNQHQIFINLGYPEGFGRPAAEAMACGAVVVGFTGGGGDDFMRNGVNSFIAPDGDETELIKQLSYALHDAGKAQLADMSLQAREIIAKTYTKAAQAEQLYTLFKTAIGKIHTTHSIQKLYKTKTAKAIGKKRQPIYAQTSKETLELQLFYKRQEFETITSSKFFAVWQAYCKVRDIAKNALMTKVPVNLPTLHFLRR